MNKSDRLNSKLKSLIEDSILISTNTVDLVKIISYMSYLIIGARFEEKRMKTNMEGYDIMHTRGFFFPYRAKHFQILLGRDISSEKKSEN